MADNMLQSLDEVIEKTRELKKQGKCIALCHGMFDSLHIGHMRYLRQALNYGDFVVVSVIADTQTPTEEKPGFNEKMRAEAIASLGWIDAVVINPFINIYELIMALKPDVFIKGFESSSSKQPSKETIEFETLFLKKIGVKLIVVKESDFTSTSQINRFLANFPEDIQKYIELFKERYKIDLFFEALDNMRQLKVLVIGDMILDDYHYCNAIGKSSKDPTLVLQYESKDIFTGGVGAVANHIAGFADNVDLITVLGDHDNYEEFIHGSLKKNIVPYFLYKNNSPTLVKRRFIDGYSMNKLLEVYIMNDSYLSEEQDQQFYDMIDSKLFEYDLVVVSDFGHGTISSKIKKLLSEKASYLAVNAQSNAGNRGFNTITKYPKADFIAMAEHEIRLEMRDTTERVFPMMSHLFDVMHSKMFAVTRGRNGCMILGPKKNFANVPSFAQKVVDRVGAGDAFFSVTALGAIQNVSPEILGFLGNAAGSLAVEIMGNQKTIDKNTVAEYLERLLG